MNKSVFATNINVVKKDRSITIAAAAGALAGLCGTILDERSTTKTIAATAAYGLATTALIDATVNDRHASSTECYMAFGVVGTATTLMGCFFNNQYGESADTEE